MSPATGELVALATIATAILIAAAVRGLCRAVRLERVLEDHDRAEAGRADMEAIVDATREPPPLSDGQADRLLRAVQDGEEL